MRPLSKYCTRWELPGSPAKGSVALWPGTGPHTHGLFTAPEATSPSVRAQVDWKAGCANWAWEKAIGSSTLDTTTIPIMAVIVYCALRLVEAGGVWLGIWFYEGMGGRLMVPYSIRELF